MKIASFASTLLILLLLECGSRSAHAVLTTSGFMTNGSFENGLNGWIADQATSGVRLVHTNKIGTFGVFRATEGSSFAVLDASNRRSSATAPASLTQVVTLGTVFSFDWNYLGQDYGPFDDPFVVKVGTMGTVLNVGIVSLGDYAVTGWRTTTVNTAALAGQTATISFTLTNMSDASNPPMTLIDNVRITGPIPEPSSAFYGLGLVTAALATMRRRGRAGFALA